MSCIEVFLGRSVWSSIADYKTCGEDGLIE